ncbi:MAG: GGDEF domain-containing protein, partial [Acidobacteriota bacterium]|nr:GGDEF domain-containing protein [Acidobacteriota bacterium]
VRGHRAAVRAARPPLDLSFAARLYLGVVIAAAAVACGQSYVRLPTHVHGWEAFAALTVLATLSQVYVVEGRNNQSYRTSIAFLVAALVVLGPAFIGPLVVLHYIPSWFKDRTRGLVQSFNIANTALAMIAAGAAFHALSGEDVTREPAGRYALAGLAAVAVFVVVNHVLLARMISLASGRTMRATGLFSFESLSTDLGLAALGVGVAAFWSVNGWLIFFVLGPLLIIHRALYVPQLRELAQADVKTGLMNAKEFEHAVDMEVARAERMRTPFSILMVDLDHLREINNAHGHLAGDVVIRGIADVFREQLRRYDVPARFGGDEFCVLLPDTAAREAARIAERIRAAVAGRAFMADAASDALRVTVSIGLASSPDDATNRQELVHRADLAAYRAKAAGGNRSIAA